MSRPIFRVLSPEKQQHEKSDTRQQEQLPPTAHANIVETARAHGKARAKQEQHNNVGNWRREKHLQNDTQQNLE